MIPAVTTNVWGSIRSVGSSFNAKLLAAVTSAPVSYRCFCIEHLFRRHNAYVRTEDSYTFLHDLFMGDMSPSIISVFAEFWPHLIERGLDVNGKYNNGRGNVLTALYQYPHAIEMALKFGADPFIQTTDSNLNPVAFIQHRLANDHLSQSLRSKITSSMHLIVKAQQTHMSHTRMYSGSRIPTYRRPPRLT
jgi:hypothetical protein